MLKSPYILGFLIFALEAIFNLLIGNYGYAALVGAFLVGMLYSYQTGILMSLWDRMKVLLIYVPTVFIIVGFGIVAEIEAGSYPHTLDTLSLSIAGTLVIFYIIALYSLIGIGGRLVLFTHTPLNRGKNAL